MCRGVFYQTVLVQLNLCQNHLPTMAFSSHYPCLFPLRKVSFLYPLYIGQCALKFPLVNTEWLPKTPNDPEVQWLGLENWVNQVLVRVAIQKEVNWNLIHSVLPSPWKSNKLSQKPWTQPWITCFIPRELWNHLSVPRETWFWWSPWALIFYNNLYLWHENRPGSDATPLMCRT